MKFTPKTKNEIAAEGLIPNGTVCDFEVLEAEEATSKAGNEMVALKMKVWRPDGSTTFLRDWLVSSFQAKILGFAEATGMEEAYHAGAMHADDMMGKCGKLKVGIDPEKDGYPPRNKVASYVAASAGQAARQPAPALRLARAKAALDDDIPFAAEWR